MITFLFIMLTMAMPPRCNDWYLKYDTLFDCIEDIQSTQPSGLTTQTQGLTTQTQIVTATKTSATPIVESSTIPTILTSMPSSTSSTTTTTDENVITLTTPTTAVQTLTIPNEETKNSGNQVTPWWLRPWFIIVIM